MIKIPSLILNHPLYFYILETEPKFHLAGYELKRGEQLGKESESQKIQAKVSH